MSAAAFNAVPRAVERTARLATQHSMTMSAVRRQLSTAASRGPVQQLACAGCAGMFPYMLGVTRSIQERHGDVVAKRIAAVGGASAGNFGALLLATGISAKALHEDAHLDLIRAVARRGGPLFRWNDCVFDGFLEYLGDVAPNAFARASGRLHISLSRVTGTGVRLERKTDFSSNEELVDSMIASAFVPLAYTYRPPYVFHASRPAVQDGGWFVDASVQDPKPTPLPVDEYPRLVLHHRMFRKDLPLVAPISCDESVVDGRYRMGYEDAEAHADVLAASFGGGGGGDR
jgi:hypothetical protein